MRGFNQEEITNQLLHGTAMSANNQQEALNSSIQQRSPPDQHFPATAHV